MALIEKDIKNEIINIGSNQQYSINNVLDIIKKDIGDFSLRYIESRKVDVPYSILNIDKMKSFIDIKFTPIEDGIKKTFNWLKNKLYNE